MKAAERTLLELLHSPHQYIIPVFQRYYSWEVSNWEQLLDDVGELMKPGAKDRRQFMGSIVTVPDGHQPGSVPAYQVIDGQQRLTTLSLLLCAIRDHARSKGWTDLGEETDENYLVHRFKKNRERYKLFLRQRDRNAYIALVDGKDGKEASTGGQIVAGYRFFTKRLEHLASDESVLREFINALVRRLDFVAITLGAENPYKIFRSLNSTGVDLTEADLIRNRVFMSLPVEEQDDLDDSVWKKLESHYFEDGKLNGRQFEAFLRDALMRDGTYIGRDETFESFERRYPIGEFDPRTVVTALSSAANVYDWVRGAVKHPNAVVEAALQNIRELNVTTAYPLVMVLLEKAERNELTVKDLVGVLRAIASFVLRRYVCESSSREYGRWFVSACQKLNGSVSTQVAAFLLEKGWPSDEEFRGKFLHYNLYESKYARAVLGALEIAVQAKSEPVLLNGCSIEHVMPQTIRETEEDGLAWIAMLGPDWDKTYSRWRHTAGNLTLVGADYNSGMSNSAFDIKKPVLGVSKVYLNKHFADSALEQWTRVEIEHRGKALADLAVRIWPHPTA